MAKKNQMHMAERMPTAMQRAVQDSGDYLIGLRSGKVIRCNAASIEAEGDYLEVENANVVYPQGLDFNAFSRAGNNSPNANIRISDIEFLVDLATSKAIEP